MKIRLPFIFISIIMITALLSACSLDFIAPYQIRDASGGDLEQASIAVDPSGQKYIAGLNSDQRVVYYRTYLGPAEEIKTMAANSKDDQDRPEIAVLDDGTAVLVWIEYMKLSTQYQACYTMIPLSGSYINTCTVLDAGHLGSGLVRVVARGYDAYVIYDRVEGDLTTLFYKQVAGGSASGMVRAINEAGSYIAHTNMAIDSLGNLHVAGYIYRPANNDFMFYSSNAAVNAEGGMDQQWTLLNGNSLTSTTHPAGISFFNGGAGEQVVIAFVYYDGGTDGDEIQIKNCAAVGCTDQTSALVPLAEGHYWMVSQVNLVGSSNQYHISFISDQTVWLYTGPVGSSPMAKTTSDDGKTRLHMVLGGGTPVMGYIQYSTGVWSEVFVNSLFVGNKLVFHTEDCTTHSGIDMASNNSDVAGVWTYCGQTWFSTNAYTSTLPIIMK